MQNKQNLEQEFKSFLYSRNIQFKDNSHSTSDLDLTIMNPYSSDEFHIELKEKTRYNLSNWPSPTPINNLFILDQLTYLKQLTKPCNYVTVIRDNTVNSKYYVLFPHAIPVAVKALVKRNAGSKRNGEVLHKGKYLIELDCLYHYDSLESVYTHISKFMKTGIERYISNPEYIPSGWDDKTASGGIPRGQYYRKYDTGRYQDA